SENAVEQSAGRMPWAVKERIDDGGAHRPMELHIEDELAGELAGELSRALDVPAAWRLNVHAVEIGNGNWLPEDAQPIRTSAAFAANRVGHRKAGADFCTAAGVDRRTCVICTQEVFARTNRRLR